MKIRNIVIINDFDYIQGGASTVAIQTANMLSDTLKDVNVYFFSGKHDEKTQLNEKIIKISCGQEEALLEKNRLKGIINGLYNFYSFRILKKTLEQLDSKDTIINIHGWTKVLSSSIFRCIFKMKFKVIVTLHDYFSSCPNGGYFNYKTNKICENKPLSVKCLFCNCDSRNYFIKLYRLVRQFIQKNLVGVNRNVEYCIGISDFSISKIEKNFSNAKIKKIHNPIDLADVSVSSIANNKYYIFLGRLSPEKGISQMCEALEKCDNVLVIGDGPLKEELEKKYKKIKFVGWKSHDEVEEYFRETRMLILPSLWYEGAPLVPLEAMNYGIPCVISDKCAAREYISNDNGELYNTDDSKTLKEAILKIEKNIEHYSSSAKEYAEMRKKENYVKNIVSYFEEVMGTDEKN